MSNSRFANRDLQEWSWVIVVSILALAISTLPYVCAYHMQTPELVFNGALWDRPDVSIHLATMQSGLHGEWVYRFRFTGELQPGAYVKMFYIWLGHLARWGRLDIIFAYHLARWGFGLLTCLAAYAWLAMTLDTRRARQFGFLLALFGSGLGWLQLLISQFPEGQLWPIDFWLIDAYLFFGILVFPHYAAVSFLMIGMVVGFLDDLNRPSFWKVILVALAGILLQFIQSFAPLLPFVAMAGGLVVRTWERHRIPWRGVAAYLGIGLVQIPLLAYNLYVFNQPFWLKFASQNLTLSPPWMYYLWGFALLWPFALMGIWRLVNELVGLARLDRRIALQNSLVGQGAAFAWLIAALVLVFVPTNLQRRFIHAFILPLSILTLIGIFHVFFPWLERRGWFWLLRRRTGLLILFLSVANLSTIYLVAGQIFFVSNRPVTLYEPAALVDAVNWLNRQAAGEGVVLAAEQTSQFVAANTNLSVYSGHGMETLDYPAKKQRVKEFFSGMASPDWLQSCGCQWVIDGPHEQKLVEPRISTLESWYLGNLAPAYQNENVTIYRVLP